MFFLLVTSLFSSIDPHSISKNLAFYELYPESKEGSLALERVRKLLHAPSDFPIEKLSPVINRFSKTGSLTEEEMGIIETLAESLPNRKLKGYSATSENEVLALPIEDIDLGKALLLSQHVDPDQVRNYSAQLDIMALQVLGRITLLSPPEEKIRALNQFIFEECRFRFPPHSIYSKEIDLYTFLPSVMDNHLGVCLGVTAMYLSIAQRISLNLEILTPPGHIFLRYQDENKKINIETTARGVHVGDAEYLGVNLPSLKERTLKEVIGMTHVNQASIYLHQEKFEKAEASYRKALAYLPDDPMVNELLGLSLLFIDKEEEGIHLLKAAHAKEDATKMLQDNLAEDFLTQRVDKESLKVIFMQVDEKRESILEKQKKLLGVVAKYPTFRAGLEQLAVTYLQLNRNKEAITYLLRYHEIDPKNTVIAYYLAELFQERQDFPRAWAFLKKAESLTLEKGFSPKPLKMVRKALQHVCPEE